METGGAGDDEESAGTRVVQPGQRASFRSQGWLVILPVSSSHSTRRTTYGRSGPWGWSQVSAVYLGKAGAELLGLKLLGFKDRSELLFEDNIKHSQFIYPDEMVLPTSSLLNLRLTTHSDLRW
jgi:hypothetical protein